MFLPLQTATTESPQPSLPISAAEMADYVGKYRYGHESTIELVIHDGKLETDDAVPIIKVGDHHFVFLNPHDPSTQFWIVRGSDEHRQFLYIGLHAWAKVI